MVTYLQSSCHEVVSMGNMFITCCISYMGIMHIITCSFGLLTAWDECSDTCM